MMTMMLMMSGKVLDKSSMVSYANKVIKENFHFAQTYYYNLIC